MHALNKSTVEGFSNTIVLRGVVHCEPVLSAFPLQEHCEISACVFPTPVGV